MPSEIAGVTIEREFYNIPSLLSLRYGGGDTSPPPYHCYGKGACCYRFVIYPQKWEQRGENVGGIKLFVYWMNTDFIDTFFLIIKWCEWIVYQTGLAIIATLR